MVRESVAVARLPTWTRVVQKGQQTDALLKRLKLLRQELCKAEQAEVANEVLDHVRPQLLHDDLIFHKNKDVRTTLANCLAELLRLYAPDCPFDDDELLTIFTFFLAVLTSTAGGLSKSNGSQYGDCVQLLERLVSTRAFALLCDRGINEKPMVEYAEAFFSLIKADTAKNVELFLSECLSLFVQYSNVVPSKFVKILIDHFHPKVQRSNSAAANLARLVGNAATDELQASVAQYFAEAIAKAAQTVDEEDRESSLYAIHILIAQVHKASPGLLVNVIPQLEEESHAEDAKLRLIAVRTLGHIFADRSSFALLGPSSIQRHPSAWKTWLGRKWDKSNGVRLAWVEATAGILSHRNGVDAEVLKHFEQKLFDSDEKVRLAAINVFGTLNYSVLRSIPHTVLQTLGGRVKDKRHSVRAAALDSLGRAFHLSYEDMQNGEKAALEAFAWIPSVMCEAPFSEDARGSLLAAQSSFERHIIPLPVDVEEETKRKWASRFLFVLRHLDEECMNVLMLMCNLQGARMHIPGFLEACKRFNGGVVESSQAESVKRSLLRHISALADHFADPLRAGQDLEAFARNNDARSYKLLAALIDAKTDLKATIKIFSELTKRMSTERFSATLRSVTLQAGYLFLNTSTVPFLFEELEEKDDTSSPSLATPSNLRIFQLIKAIGKSQPQMLLPHFATLKAHLYDEACGVLHLAACLMCLYKLQVKFSEEEGVIIDESDLQHVKSLVLRRSSVEQAKWASKILAHSASNLATSTYAYAYHAVEDVCQTFCNDMPLNEADKLVATLMSLRQIVKVARETLAESGDELVETLVKHVLTTPLLEQTCDRSSKGEESGAEQQAEWLEECEMSDDLQARLMAIRFITDRCYAYADHDEIETIATPVLRLLVTCMTQGEASPGTCGAHLAAKARIRFEASARLIKLSRKSSCDKLISVSDFQLLSHLFQDEVWQIRHMLVRKLCKFAMHRSKLPARFYVLGFMVAFDPEEENRLIVVNTFKRLLSVMKSELRLRYFDIGLARLIHLLNHHPDFEDQVAREDGFSINSLAEVARYFEFYLECCATKENFSCLHHIARRSKGMRDVFDEDRRPMAEDDGIASQGIHTLSDLCICLIRRKAESFGCTLGEWQGQVALPRDLYLPYANREEQAKVLQKSYLTNEAIDLFTQPTRRDKGVHSSSIKRKALLQLDQPTTHTKKAKTTTAKKKKAAKAKPWSREIRASSERSEEEDDDNVVESETESENSGGADEDVVSEDESVESSEDEDTAGRGVRTRRRLRQEKRLRNESRRQRREAQAQKNK